jgi:hypothetical protein
MRPRGRSPEPSLCTSSRIRPGSSPALASANQSRKSPPPTRVPADRPWSWPWEASDPQLLRVVDPPQRDDLHDGHVPPWRCRHRPERRLLRPGRESFPSCRGRPTEQLCRGPNARRRTRLGIAGRPRRAIVPPTWSRSPGSCDGHTARARSPRGRHAVVSPCLTRPSTAGNAVLRRIILPIAPDSPSPCSPPAIILPTCPRKTAAHAESQRTETATSCRTSGSRSSSPVTEEGRSGTPRPQCSASPTAATSSLTQSQDPQRKGNHRHLALPPLFLNRNCEAPVFPRPRYVWRRRHQTPATPLYIL